MKCPHCGHGLDPIAPGVIRCPKCGNLVDVEPSDVKMDAEAIERVAEDCEDFGYFSMGH